ncbi:MAG: aminotransferase class IV, partial [bacterium]
KKGVLMTPSLETGILSGITRQAILRAAARAGIQTAEKLIKTTEVYRADEVFITNTTMGIMPVRQVDQARYTKRQITDLLASAYGKEIQQEVRKGRGLSRS